MAAFVKAQKYESKLRLAITGPSGAGKTYTALSIAKHLPGPIALVDTEHGSASKYADLFDFDVLNLQPPYHPDRFCEAIREAADAGYKVVILDSLTHAWNGTGGMLELVDEIAKRKTGGNTFAAWKDAGPIQSRLIEGIVGAPLHVIATLRSKQDYAQEKNDQGRTVIRKVGMAAQQREGFEYEFDVVIDMDIDHVGIVTKTRCPALTDRAITKPGREVADTLTDWLKGAPAPQPKPAPEPPVWADWRNQDDAIGWAARTLADDYTDAEITAHYTALKAEVKPRKAADMFAAWVAAIEAEVADPQWAQPAAAETAQPLLVDAPAGQKPGGAAYN